METHKHTHECYAQDSHGFVYTPCRADGLDRNLRRMKRVDFEASFRVDSIVRGCVLVCGKEET